MVDSVLSLDYFEPEKKGKMRRNSVFYIGARILHTPFRIRMLREQ